VTADPSQPRDSCFPNQPTAVAAVTARLAAVADFEAHSTFRAGSGFVIVFSTDPDDDFCPEADADAVAWLAVNIVRMTGKRGREALQRLALIAAREASP